MNSWQGKLRNPTTRATSKTKESVPAPFSRKPEGLAAGEPKTSFRRTDTLQLSTGASRSTDRQRARTSASRRTTCPHPPSPPTRHVRLGNDDQRWQAVLRHDASADGRFVYAVRTTGVYCRPSCPSRRPRRENVEFHATPSDAERRVPALQAVRPGGAVAGERARRVDRAGVPDHRRRPTSARAGDTGRGGGDERVALSPDFQVAHRADAARYAAAHRSRASARCCRARTTVTAAALRRRLQLRRSVLRDGAKVLGMRPASFRARRAGATVRFAVGECWLGPILVAASDVGICAIAIGDDPDARPRPPGPLPARRARRRRRGVRATRRPRRRLRPRARGRAAPAARRPRHRVPTTRVAGSACDIPSGTTRSYAELAGDLGRPRARVAAACAANGIAVAIPCHRVVHGRLALGLPLGRRPEGETAARRTRGRRSVSDRLLNCVVRHRHLEHFGRGNGTLGQAVSPRAVSSLHA